MNVTPISFGRIYQIKGNNSEKVAKQVVELFKEAGDNVYTYKNNKGHYVFTGNEANVAKTYEDGMNSNVVSGAAYSSEVAKIVLQNNDAAVSNFINAMVSATKPVSIEGELDSKTNRVCALNIKA